MEPADLYKLLHQGWLGPAHGAATLDVVLAYLKEERSLLETEGFDEPRLEPLPGPHGLVRVHLREWPAARDSVLASAFVSTAEAIVPDREGLERALVEVAPHLERLGLRFDADEWQAYVDARIAEGLPAVHHSAAYREGYSPAYRVVLPSLLGEPTGPGQTADVSRSTTQIMASVGGSTAAMISAFF